MMGSDIMAKSKKKVEEIETVETVEEVPEKNIKVHNYIILVLLFLACIGLVLYLCKLYEVEREERRKIPIIRESLSEIYPEDLEHYVLDNPTSLIYMCTANDDICRDFEKGFKKLLKKNNYNDAIIYLNLTEANQGEFVNTFNQSYPYKGGITAYYPAFVLFEDGKIKGILQGTETKKLTLSKAKSFLDLNRVGE